MTEAEKRIRELFNLPQEIFITEAYRESLLSPDPSADGLLELSRQWENKKHRHVFDLCSIIDQQQEMIEQLKKG